MNTHAVLKGPGVVFLPTPRKNKESRDLVGRYGLQYGPWVVGLVAALVMALALQTELSKSYGPCFANFYVAECAE